MSWYIQVVTDNITMIKVLHMYSGSLQAGLPLTFAFTLRLLYCAEAGGCKRLRLQVCTTSLELLLNLVLTARRVCYMQGFLIHYRQMQ